MPEREFPLCEVVTAGYTVLVRDTDGGTIWRGMVKSAALEYSVIHIVLLYGRTKVYRPEWCRWFSGFKLENLVVNQGTILTAMGDGEFQCYVPTGKLCFLPGKQYRVPLYF